MLLRFAVQREGFLVLGLQNREVTLHGVAHQRVRGEPKDVQVVVWGHTRFISTMGWCVVQNSHDQVSGVVPP
jgi:hypothetical protein